MGIIRSSVRVTGQAQDKSLQDRVLTLCVRITGNWRRTMTGNVSVTLLADMVRDEIGQDEDPHYLAEAIAMALAHLVLKGAIQRAGMGKISLAA